jgi:hypothetical protein
MNTPKYHIAVVGDPKQPYKDVVESDIYHRGRGDGVNLLG